MANRPYLDPTPVITNGSMAGNLTSLVTILQQKSMISYGLSWIGTSPVGTVSCQLSNDYSLYPNGTVNNAGTWSTMTLNYDNTSVTTIPVSGNTGNGMVDIDLTAAYAIRLIFTHTSGTGTLQVLANAKVS